MRLRLRYFGAVREAMGIADEELQVQGIACIAELAHHLITHHGELRAGVLSSDNLCSARNKVLANGDCPVADGDEIAFFPPVTGG